MFGLVSTNLVGIQSARRMDLCEKEREGKGRDACVRGTRGLLNSPNAYYANCACLGWAVSSWLLLLFPLPLFALALRCLRLPCQPPGLGYRSGSPPRDLNPPSPGVRE